MRYTEGALKPFGYLKMDPLNYICHSWLSENEIIVGTSACTLLILESGDVKEEIKLTTGKLELFFLLFLILVLTMFSLVVLFCLGFLI